ncbi:MAG: hypothetical protein Q9199_007594, partial [Rusavskia elegans]
MPGEDFPYYITRSPYKSYSPLGFLFKHYDHRNSSLPNDIIQQTLVEAGHKIEEQLIQNPILENQTLDDKWLYIQEEQNNLPNMPGGYGFTFPYHMTPDNSLGLVFNHYDLSPFDNDVIEEALVEATNRYDREIAGDPTLANQTLDRQWQYDHNPHDQGEDYYTLFINP